MLLTSPIKDENPKGIDPILVIVLVILAFFLFVTLKNCATKNDYKSQNTELNNSLMDSLRYYRKKDSLQVATIKVIQTLSVKDFTTLKTKDAEIAQLQLVVHEYENKLKVGNSVTNTTTQTKVSTKHKTKVEYPITLLSDSSFINKDSTKSEKKLDRLLDSLRDIRGDRRIDDTAPALYDKSYMDNHIYPIYPTYSDSLKNKWIDYKAVMSKDSSTFDLQVTNEYSTIVGTEHGKPFVDVINYNPYSTTTSLRTYQVQMPSPKRWGIGLSTGITINSSLRPAPYIGAGLNYNLIRF